ncbi:MAG: DUF1819 family protein [Bacteroidales bacterium]|nr:DUF1819 family protein [Bacteroidales bacterium]
MKVKKYSFSFTGLSLRLDKMHKVAIAEFEGREINLIQAIGNGKESTTKRVFWEISLRLKMLTKEQLDFFVKGDLTSRKQIAFLSVCKSYGFIRDFVIEVLREKYLLFDYHLTDGDYNSFFRKKAELYPEMEELSELTEKKIKQVTFKILEQAEIINNIKEKVIQAQILDQTVKMAIVNDDKKWLMIFMLSDLDISR